MTVHSGRNPISRFAFGRSSLIKPDGLPGGLGQLAAEQIFQSLAAASGNPAMVRLAPGEVPGTAHRRGKPDLAIRSVFVNKKFATGFGLDSQNALHQFNIEIATGRFEGRMT